MNVRLALRPKPRSPAGPAPAGAVPALALLAVVASSVSLAAVVVLRHLGTKPLWRDEAISISVAARPVTSILPVLTHHDANAGLYYLLLHAWVGLGGTGAAWARGFSAVCFMITAGLAAWAGTRWRGWPVGAACGLLVATNPFLVYYGQETRPYALAACLAVVSVANLFGRWDEPMPRAYTAATIALIYTDLFAVLFVAALAATVAALHRSRSEPIPPVLIRCWALIAAATAPLGLIMVLGQGGQIAWLPRPRLVDLELTVTRMTGGWTGLFVVVLLGMVAVAGAGGATGRGGRVGRERRIVIGLAVAAFVPPPLLYAAAQIVPCFIDRYVICSAIAFIGLAAAGLDELRRRPGTVPGGSALAALAVLALLVGLGAQRTVRMEADRYKVDNAPGAVAFITSHAVPGDAIGYAGGGLRMVVAASLRDTATFPTDVALAPGGEALRQHDLYAREVTTAELARRLVPVQRLWVVTDPTDHRFPQDGPLARLRPSLASQFTSGLTGSFDAIDVTLYIRRSP